MLRLRQKYIALSPEITKRNILSAYNNRLRVRTRCNAAFHKVDIYIQYVH